MKHLKNKGRTTKTEKKKNENELMRKKTSACYEVREIHGQNKAKEEGRNENDLSEKNIRELEKLHEEVDFNKTTKKMLRIA